MFQVKFNYSDNVNTVDTITVDLAKAEPSDSSVLADTPANLNVSKVEQSVEISACGQQSGRPGPQLFV